MKILKTLLGLLNINNFYYFYFLPYENTCGIILFGDADTISQHPWEQLHVHETAMRSHQE